MHSLGAALPIWSVVPFAGLLACMAGLPQLAPDHWHLRNQLAIALAWAAPVVAGLLWLGATLPGGDGALAVSAIGRALEEYASFLILLGSLFVVTGGVLITGDLPARPWVNTAFLAAGAVLASLIGTTGAAMLLIRPVLRTNSEREHTWHVPVFFIFVVANVGGVLTPIGDPPLFLGYLRGVPFEWTLVHLWPYWLGAVLTLLALFYAVDTRQYARETLAHRELDTERVQPLRVDGWANVGLLALVVLAVLVLTPGDAPDDPRRFHLRDLALVGLGALSLRITPRAIRESNTFSWHPILEVGALFLGIFLTMIPATALLESRGEALALEQPWQYFWASGLLSSFLDNAPTYVTFAALACGSFPADCTSASQLGSLTHHPAAAEVLAAISLGSVFMGANTYIGNGPNFMVRAIAEQSGVRMPTFLGYAALAAVILGPVFLAISVFAL